MGWRNQTHKEETEKMSPSKPPEPEPGTPPSDKPGGVIYKDGKPITVKRKPTKKETREKRRIEKERRQERQRIEERAREARAREEAEKVSVPRKEFPEAPELPEHLTGIEERFPTPPSIPSRAERPGEMGLPSDKRLDTQALPGEPTLLQRLHGKRTKAQDPSRISYGLDEKLDDVKAHEDPGRLTAKDKMILTQSWGALGGQLALKFQGIEKFYTQTVRTPIQMTVGKRRAEAARLREEGKFFEGWGYDIAAHFSKAGLGALDIMSTIVRPSAMIGTVTGPFKLATDPEARKYAITRFKGDPHGALAYAGGAYVGGRLLGMGVEKVKEAEMRHVLGKYTEEDWLPYESTHPQPRSTLYENWARMEEDVTVVDGKTGGFPSEHLMPRGKYPTGARGRAIDKKLWGYVETGHDVIPMQIPKGMGSTQKVLKIVKQSTSIRTDAWGRYAYGLPKGGRVRGISELGGMIGLASTLRTGDRTLEKQTQEILGKTKTDLWEDPVQRFGDLPVTISKRGTTTSPRVIDLAGYTQFPGTWTEPGYIQETIQEQKQKQRQRQKQEPLMETITRAPGIAPPSTKRKRRRIDLTFPEKRGKPISLKGLTSVGETRLRPIKPPRLKK